MMQRLVFFRGEAPVRGWGVLDPQQERRFSPWFRPCAAVMGWGVLFQQLPWGRPLSAEVRQALPAGCIDESLDHECGLVESASC